MFGSALAARGNKVQPCLVTITQNTKQFKEEVNNIILHHIQLQSTAVPPDSSAVLNKFTLTQLTCSLTHTQALGKQIMASLSPWQARLSFPITSAQTQTQPLYEKFNYLPVRRLFSPDRAVTIVLFSFAHSP